jgi:hypothetical protein
MDYPTKDTVAAISDLIAFSGTMIQVGGVNVRAYVEKGGSSFTASEFGIDNREDDVTATIRTRGMIPPTQKHPVVIHGRRMKITEIETINDEVMTLTLSND